MNQQFLQGNLQSLTYQRNLFAGLAILAISAILLLCGLLYCKSERVIVAPPTIDREFWVDSHSVSSTYLEQFGVFLGQLLLGKSAQSAENQRTVILRHTDPVFTPILRKKLIDEEELLKRQSAAYTFYITEVKVDQGSLRVRLIGDRVLLSGGKQLSSEKEAYLLQFVFTNSRLLLTDISEVKSGEKSI